MRSKRKGISWTQVSPTWSSPEREGRKTRPKVRPNFLSVAAFSPPTPLRSPFPTDHQRTLALGARDSTPCSGTAVSGIRSSAWSLCRQHPGGGARGGTAEVRGKPLLAPGTWASSSQSQTLRTHRFGGIRKPKGCGTPKGMTPNLGRSGGIL